MHTFDKAPLRSESPPQKHSGMASCSQGISQFYLHIHTFIRNWSEPCLPLPSQPQLVLIYRPWRDGRLSIPWCEVAPAKIRTRSLPIANPALYHTATSAPRFRVRVIEVQGTSDLQPHWRHMHMTASKYVKFGLLWSSYKLPTVPYENKL